MSTSALVLMILVWSYIVITLVYLFSKLLRKEREKKRNAESLHRE
ncbi:MAG: hypothetical protein HW412_558 [Bacteroidetes bacterium]|nr:hypothetical protein [Bacteroidota bacterium]